MKSLDSFSSPKQLFYVTESGKYVAYWPKGYEGEKSTLQSRNFLIGKYTEKFVADLLSEVVEPKGFFTINDAICEEISLTPRLPADVVVSTANKRRLVPEEIKLIIEVKMSLVWNWKLTEESQQYKIECIGDYMSHQGNPGLLRFDSMLKAIGKAINIRVSSFKSSNIPIIIIGNTPINRSYVKKVDQLKIAGILQGFYSINPNPINDAERNIKSTDKEGFYRFDSFKQVGAKIIKLLSEELIFFSSMKSGEDLGKIISLANQKKTYEEKAKEFLRLIRE